MIERLLKYLKFGKNYTAIEYGTHKGEELIQLLVLSKVKNEFTVKAQKQYHSLVDVKLGLSKSNHCFLIINNNLVISKVIPKEENEQIALQKAFPSLKISEFYYELIQLEENTYITICRKENVEKIVTELKGNNINCIGYSLGNCSVSQLIPFVKTSYLTTSNASISIKENQLKSITIDPVIEHENYTINGLDISNSKTLSLAGIISYYTNQSHTVSNFKNEQYKLTKDFTAENYFKKGMKLGLGILFTLLLINFLMFDYYSKKVENLNFKNQLNKANKAELVVLLNEITSKKRLVEDSSTSKGSIASHYFDEIGGSVPTTVALTALNYQPLLKKIEDNKEIILKTNILSIKGESTDGDNFTNWISKLEKMVWINSIKILEYGKSKNETSFTIEIKIQ